VAGRQAGPAAALWAVATLPRRPGCGVCAYPCSRSVIEVRSPKSVRATPAIIAQHPWRLAPPSIRKRQVIASNFIFRIRSGLTPLPRNGCKRAAFCTTLASTITGECHDQGRRCSDVLLRQRVLCSSRSRGHDFACLTKDGNSLSPRRLVACLVGSRQFLFSCA
jgi:hypothetical protein